jgi:hypothetical protein
MRPADTSPEAWEVFLACVRRMSPAQRMLRALELSDMVRGLAEQGVRQRFPQADEREVFLRVARLRLGDELFRKAYGEDALPDGDGALDGVA